jgi:hypothetical protein
MTKAAIRREQIRQGLMMQALRGGQAAALAGWARATARADLSRGLAVYSANAAVHADRALAARYPTVQALIGAESFASMAQVVWRQHPPRQGDLARWGDALPDFLSQAEPLADEPYLADVARLDDAVSRAAGAADVDTDLATLMRLGDTGAERLRLVPAAGMALIDSVHPVVSIWRAHHDPNGLDRADVFAEARQALAERRAETALVWRHDWQVRVVSVDDAPTREFLCRTLLQGQSLADALDQPGLDFGRWLAAAVTDGLLVRVEVTAAG